MDAFCGGEEVGRGVGAHLHYVVVKRRAEEVLGRLSKGRFDIICALAMSHR